MAALEGVVLAIDEIAPFGLVGADSLLLPAVTTTDQLGCLRQRANLASQWSVLIRRRIRRQPLDACVQAVLRHAVCVAVGGRDPAVGAVVVRRFPNLTASSPRLAQRRAYHVPVDGASPRPTKVAFDRLLSGIFLVVTLPVSLVIAAAIAVENAVCPSRRGGLFHSEVRMSAGRPFTLYKFRILTPEGEQEVKAGATPKHVENNPNNLTRVGAVLKKIGLDELPQFLNVLTGNMSLVGPRPKPRAEYNEEMDRGVVFRAQLQAGLTGPAQVLKGTVRTDDHSLRADLDYADLLRHGSQLEILAYDAKTLLKTIRVLFRATGE